MLQQPSCPVKPYLEMKQIPNDLFFSYVETEIAEGRSVRFRLKGVSMFPLIRGGKDEVVLRPCSAEELRPMDVILFKYKGNYLLHRIIKREGDFLYIQGDGSFVAKEVCTTDDVVGKVCTIVRKNRKVISVDSWRWKLPSFLWRNTGFLRPYFLYLFRCLFPI